MEVLSTTLASFQFAMGYSIKDLQQRDNLLFPVCPSHGNCLVQAATLPTYPLLGVVPWRKGLYILTVNGVDDAMVVGKEWNSYLIPSSFHVIFILASQRLTRYNGFGQESGSSWTLCFAPWSKSQPHGLKPFLGSCTQCHASLEKVGPSDCY